MIFFSPAISFTLGYSNEIDSLSQEFRHFNGSVEIIFNIDQNDATKAFLKNHGNNQITSKISLRRSIQSQQIEYYLGESRVERVDVKNFLQLYGFAESYPFQYAIQCNDISAVEMSNDRDRLQWLKNCCGVDEFSKKRDKSMRILDETDEQIRKIDASLAKIDVQLKLFASKENQQIYQEWMKRERELGHLKCRYRIKKVRAELENVNLDLELRRNLIESIKIEIIQWAKNGTELRREIKVILDKLSALKMNERNLEVKIDKCKGEKLEIEGVISKLQIAVQQGALFEDLTIQEKCMYSDKMDETRTQIDDTNGEIERIAETKYEIEQQVGELESQIDAIVLNCQQNQRLNTQFHSVEQRNQHLLGLIKKAKNAIARENRNVNKIKKEIQQEMQELHELQAIASTQQEKLMKTQADEVRSSFHQQQEMMDSLENRKW